MKKQILLLAGFIFIFVYAAAAQTRTVTNADLEKFRQRRVQAEQDYRQNYERLGLPSPEELEKQREQNRKDLAELSARLQNENLERQQRQREEDYRQAQMNNQFSQSAYGENGYYTSGYVVGYPYYGYPNYYGNGYYRNFPNRFNGKRKFGRNGGFYNTITPGTVFPQQGVRINTGGVRIGVATGGGFGGGAIGAPVRAPR